MQWFRKQSDEGHLSERMLTSLALLTFVAGCGVLIFFINENKGSLDLIFTAQAGKEAGLAVWALFFLYFTWFGGSAAPEGTEGTDKAKKASAMQFNMKKKHRYVTIGFFSLVGGFLSFGNPMLVLMSLGDDGAKEYMGGSTYAYRNYISLSTAFFLVGGLSAYAVGHGMSLLLFGLFMCCKGK